MRPAFSTHTRRLLPCPNRRSLFPPLIRSTTCSRGGRCSNGRSTGSCASSDGVGRAVARCARWRCQTLSSQSLNVRTDDLLRFAVEVLHDLCKRFAANGACQAKTLALALLRNAILGILCFLMPNSFDVINAADTEFDLVVLNDSMDDTLLSNFAAKLNSFMATSKSHVTKEQISEWISRRSSNRPSTVANLSEHLYRMRSGALCLRFESVIMSLTVSLTIAVAACLQTYCQCP